MMFGETKRGVKDTGGRNREVTVEANRLLTMLHMLNKTNWHGYTNRLYMQKVNRP
jgi:hypothetical protein